MYDMTLKDMAKLAKLKVADLATQMGMDYGPVSTAISMDEKGETPKRQSVRDRQTMIRDHLTTMLKLEQRDGAEAPRGSKLDAWESVDVANKRFPAPRGCAQTFEMEGYKLGQYVRLDLDRDGSPSLYRFLRLVTLESSGVQHVDLFGGANGGMRSITVDELRTGKRVL